MSPSTVSLMGFPNGESCLGQGIVNLVNSEPLVSQENKSSGGRDRWVLYEKRATLIKLTALAFLLMYMSLPLPDSKGM